MTISRPAVEPRLPGPVRRTTALLFPILCVIILPGCSTERRAGAPAHETAANVAAQGAISVPQHIASAVASSDRPEADRLRDPHRKPGEVLAFFGIERGMSVGDLMAGTGYYSEILSRAVGPEGSVYAQNNSFVVERFVDKPLTERLARPGLENITRLDAELETPGLPAGLDAALMIRFYHDMYWQESDRRAFNQAVFQALKPGGIFGIVDHHAPAGTGFAHVKDLHRVDAELVEKEILAAGFVLDAESDLLANPDDTRDWNIFADDAARRDQTDRFVLRFRKPS